MTDEPNVIVIGAGHNGLACAAYLAEGGQRVTVLEAAAQRRRRGGNARVRAGLQGLGLRAPVLSAGRAHRERARPRAHGLTLGARRTSRPSRCARGRAPGADRRHARSRARERSGSRGASPRITQRMLRVRARARQAAQPRSAAPAGRRAQTLHRRGAAGLDIRRLGRDDMREFLRIAGINIFDVLEESFEIAAAQGRARARRRARHQSGRRAPTTPCSTLLHRLAACAGGEARRRGAAGRRHGRGDARRSPAAATRARREIRTGTPVSASLATAIASRASSSRAARRSRAAPSSRNADPKTHVARAARRAASRHRLRAPRAAFPHARHGGQAASRARRPARVLAASARHAGERLRYRARCSSTSSTPSTRRSTASARRARRSRSSFRRVHDAHARARRQARALGGRAVRAVRRSGAARTRRARSCWRTHARR